MDSELLLNELYNDPKISFYFSLLKTSKWRELKKNEKMKFFIKFHSYLCDKLELYKDVLIIDNEHLEDKASNDTKSSNVSYDNGGMIYIQDVFYNQYLTLYEYFYVIMQKYQKRECVKSEDNDENVKEWKKNLKSFSFGDAKIDYLLSDDENYGRYQSINDDALKFAREMVFKIVKTNFDYADSYDEQYFMSNPYVLVNNRVINEGKTLVSMVELDKMDEEQKLKFISGKVKNLLDNIENVKDEELFLAIYPSVSSEIDNAYLVDIYNEILNRIYEGNLVIKTNRNGVRIGNNSYNNKKFSENHFNIVIRECLNDLDSNLKKDEDFLNSELVKEKGLEEAIYNYKKKWFYKTILYIDRKLMDFDFSLIKYQPLYRLVNKECLMKNIKKTNTTRR